MVNAFVVYGASSAAGMGIKIHLAASVVLTRGFAICRNFRRIKYLRKLLRMIEYGMVVSTTMPNSIFDGNSFAALVVERC